jgi:hypothetical protein
MGAIMIGLMISSASFLNLLRIRLFVNARPPGKVETRLAATRTKKTLGTAETVSQIRRLLTLLRNTRKRPDSRGWQAHPLPSHPASTNGFYVVSRVIDA